MFRLLFRVLDHIQWIINGILIQTIQEKTTVYKLEFIFLKRNGKKAESIMKKNEHTESFRNLTGGSVGEMYKSW